MTWEKECALMPMPVDENIYQWQHSIALSTKEWMFNSIV
jgi:hypothetical protein